MNINKSIKLIERWLDIPVEGGLDLDVSNAIELLIEFAKSMQWQPIDTAPKIGIINVACKGKIYKRIRWNLKEQFWEKEVTKFDESDERSYVWFEPLHIVPDLWTPILKPPQKPEE